MCGVTGALVFNCSDFLIEQNYIDRMRDTATMVLRGPDGAGTWISKNKKVALAHRRLSIIDLSENARQPMSNDDNSIFVSFNGEIYNHRVIRKELEKLNKYKWKTDHSDTEVIVHSFEEWGIACLDRFRGMFAIAIWDGVNEELWLVRDRLGVKPLYYSIHNGRIVFASDINAILEDPEQTRSIDEKALYDYLSFLVVPAPNTLFEGIKKLQCGTYLRIKKDGTVTLCKYWDMLNNKIDMSSMSEEKICNTLLKELQVAVNLRKESDVPVGVFLSGGIDSSINAVLFSDNGKLPIKTFTIAYEGILNSYHNEDKQAANMAKRINAEHYVKSISQNDIVNIIPMLIRLQGEPLADPVSGSQYYVSLLARKHGIVVCQLGEGSDELFHGYPLWTKMHIVEKLRRIYMPRFLKKLVLNLYGVIKSRESFQYELLRRYYEGQAVFWGTNDIFTEENKKNLLSEKMNKKFNSYTTWEVIKPIFNSFKGKAKEKSVLNWMTYIDLNIRMADLLLTKVDKMGMGVSLEARVPFLDHKFVELVMNIPEKRKIGSIKEHKYILKKSIKGLVPEEITKRKKVGFTLPLNDWYKGDFKVSISNEVIDFCKNTDYFNMIEVEKILKGQNSMKIWALYTLSLWWKEYIKNHSSVNTHDKAEVRITVC